MDSKTLDKPVEFFHQVSGRWYSSFALTKPSATLNEYKAWVRKAYGDLRGVKFASSETHKASEIAGHLYVEKK